MRSFAKITVLGILMVLGVGCSSPYVHRHKYLKVYHPEASVEWVSVISEKSEGTSQLQPNLVVPSSPVEKGRYYFVKSAVPSGSLVCGVLVAAGGSFSGALIPGLGVGIIIGAGGYALGVHSYDDDFVNTIKREFEEIDVDTVFQKAIRSNFEKNSSLFLKYAPPSGPVDSFKNRIEIRVREYGLVSRNGRSYDELKLYIGFSLDLHVNKLSFPTKYWVVDSGSKELPFKKWDRKEIDKAVESIAEKVVFRLNRENEKVKKENEKGVIAPR